MAATAIRNGGPGRDARGVLARGVVPVVIGPDDSL
jgi:hypothetical protein